MVRIMNGMITFATWNLQDYDAAPREATHAVIRDMDAVWSYYRDLAERQRPATRTRRASPARTRRSTARTERGGGLPGEP